MTVEPKTYRIGDKEYRQTKITLGQGEHLISLVSGLTIDMSSAQAIANSMAKILPKAAALVLIEDGKTRADTVKLFDEAGSRLEEKIDFLKNEMEFDMVLEVISDFLSFNPIGSLSEKFSRMMEQLGSAGQELTAASKSSMPTLPTETRARETVSGQA